MIEKINVAFSGQTVLIESLFPDPKNARRHGNKSVEAIMKSLELYGQVKPVIVLPNGQVIAGNGLLEGARRLGWTKIAVVVFENAEKAREFAIADNRIAELSQWDEDVLSQLTGEMDLKEIAGIDDKFIKKYVQESGDAAPKEKKQIQCPHCLKWLDAPKRGRKSKNGPE